MSRPFSRLPRWATTIWVLLALAWPALPATFGTVVPIGGHASDIALDEARGVVYVANFTANRIDVVSIAQRKLQSSINVGRQPAALALSPDGRWLVITHVSNFEAPMTPYNGLTLLDLSGGGNVKQTFTFGNPPIGVAFGKDGQALVLTTREFMLFDPTTGYTKGIETISGVTTRALPQKLPTSPREIIAASVTATGDGSRIFGTAEANDTEREALVFEYNVATKSIEGAYWTAEPPLGPRVVSTDQTGTIFLTGWGLFHRAGFLLAQFPGADGKFQIGSHAVDTARGIVYAQLSQNAPTASGLPQQKTGPREAVPGSNPVLMILDADNLTVRERLNLQENLSGRAILNSRADMLFAVSESGLAIFPVGSLNQMHRVATSVEDVAIRGQWCDRRTLVQEFTVSNPGGGATGFSIASTTPGVYVTASSNETPARVRVTVDMTQFQNNKGTTQAMLQITSPAAVNVIPPVRVLVNNREPDQRGTFFNVPGKLVDLQADPVRNRFYLLRQDKNQVLVFDATTYRQVATMRTGNTPWSMAITPDRQYMIIGSDNSQVAMVYNLDSMRLWKYIVFPSGHYPRSIAASNREILAACRVAGPKHVIDRIDLANGFASELPSLGIFENEINADTALAASPSGSSIFVVQPDGTVMLYDASADTFVAARKELGTLQGAFAALSDSTYAVDRYLLNSSLGLVRTLDAGSGIPSGFATMDGLGLRTAAPTSASPGVVQKVEFGETAGVRSARVTEAPTLPDTLASVFTRTLAPLPNRTAVVSLSTSGFTVLPWTYDQAVADPRIEAVVNAADNSKGVAPGGLITIWGRDLSPVNASTSETPLPTLLGDSCLTVNGTLVPMIYVSPRQINGQLPFNVVGDAAMVLHTPSGVSNTFRFTATPVAPGVFRAAVEGWSEPMPTVTRATNFQIVTPSNPVHLDDWLAIFVTGLGATTPAVETGMAGPGEPLAQAMVEPTVSLGGVKLPVGFAGMVPGTVGLYQINVKVPFRDVPTGMQIPLTIEQGSYKTTVDVRVVK